MKGSNELYRLVYDYYATRILFGFYTYGDAMPSIHKICVQFRLAVPTVRTAFTYLERDGYIQVEASKVARVVYKAAPARIMKNIVDYFLPREDGLNDIGVAGRILIEPLFTRGLQRWEEDQWNQLREWLTNPSPDTLFMPIELYILALSALDNKLLGDGPLPLLPLSVRRPGGMEALSGRTGNPDKRRAHPLSEGRVF